MASRFRQLADKYAVRAHVASTVGERVSDQALMAWETTPRAIPFDRLPAEYVIKPSHAAGQVIIVKGQQIETRSSGQSRAGWPAIIIGMDANLNIMGFHLEF